MGADTAPRLRYIALLRGVNVGRAKRIAMADLRKLVEDLGYTGVCSLLNSGNLVFDAVVPPVEAAREIEAAIALYLGVSARVFVFACNEVAEIVDDNPLMHVATDHARLFVFLLAGAPQRALAADLCGQDWAPERMGAWTSRCLCLVSARFARQRSRGSARQTARQWRHFAQLEYDDEVAWPVPRPRYCPSACLNKHLPPLVESILTPDSPPNWLFSRREPARVCWSSCRNSHHFRYR